MSALSPRDQGRLLHEIAQAKRRLGLPASAPGVRCYAAGRAGFWLHRFLQAQGIINHGVDASSIAVNRRQRRATSEALDVRKWLSRLRRYEYGERQVGHVVRVPSVAAEAPRHLHRALETLQQERASTTTRIKGLLRSQGIRLTSLSQCAEPLEAWRLGDGSALPSGLRRRVLRVYAHHEFLSQQSAALEAERRALLRPSQEGSIAKVRQLMPLKGIGLNGAWWLGMDFFRWRALKPRREGGG